MEEVEVEVEMREREGTLLVSLVTFGPSKLQSLKGSGLDHAHDARQRTEEPDDSTHKRTEGNYVDAIWIIVRGLSTVHARWPWAPSGINRLRLVGCFASVATENVAPPLGMT
jgi:hypothetical protein